jgi:hypothetical protein
MVQVKDDVLAVVGGCSVSVQSEVIGSTIGPTETKNLIDLSNTLQVDWGRLWLVEAGSSCSGCGSGSYGGSSSGSSGGSSSGGISNSGGSSSNSSSSDSSSGRSSSGGSSTVE